MLTDSTSQVFDGDGSGSWEFTGPVVRDADGTDGENPIAGSVRWTCGDCSDLSRGTPTSRQDGVVETFPEPHRPARKPCARCGHPTRVDRMYRGFGEDCAAKLGLIVATPRLHAFEQTGADLLDLLAAPPEEPEDCCDGWDR